jgi:tight adherence protein C
MTSLLPAAGMTACLVAALVGARMMRSPTPGRRFDLPEEAEVERVSLMERLYGSLGQRLGRQLLLALPPRRVKEIRHRIDAAGRPDGLTVAGYAARKTVWMVLLGGAGLLLLVLQRNVISAVLLLAVGWLTMDIWLARSARVRQASIDRDMPDFLDVLAVTVGAGVGFRPALQRVAETIEGPLSEEVLTTLRQLDLGASRRAAFEGLRDRNDSVFLNTFVTALLQGEELGAPLSDTLLDLAADMRKAFHQEARQRAQRAVPRVSLVIIMVVVPGALILLVTGILLGSADAFGDLFAF